VTYAAAVAGWIGSRRKRAIDVAVAVGLLLVTAPIIALTALVVRVRLGSPVLFRQQRAGRDAVPFEVVKFRSMSNATDADGAPLPDDERLGRFGRLLRASSLDELPQLWNVVRGDMSLIGPRPLPVAYVERYSPEQRRRLDATPGITGWAQVNGRNTVDWPERLRFDVEYVDQASFVFDVRVVGRTIAMIVRRQGISADGHVTMREFTGET
jgi:lipopolysaccharide/colanic/teichoic acid biosynthesis glycosyltransferase